MKITGAESVTYGCADVKTAGRFLTDLGFERIEGGAAGGTYRLPDNATVVLRGTKDRSLPRAPVAGDTARELTWGVDGGDELKKLADALSADRTVKEDADGVLHTTDDCGHALAFRLTAKQPVSLTPPVINTPGTRPRRNTRADGTAIRVPKLQRMAHVGYWVPEDLDRSMAFYTGRLGFRVTEYIRGVGAFLRAPGSHEHHDIFLARRGERRGLQHASYEVRDFDEVMLLGSHMESKGWETHFGPGRHIFGSNIFWYFWHPAGALLEITADLDWVDDGWTTRYHDQLPKGAGSWIVRRGDARRIPFRTREEDAIIE